MSLEKLAREKIIKQLYELNNKSFKNKKRIIYQNNYIAKLASQNIKRLARIYRKELTKKTLKEAEEIIFENVLELIKYLEKNSKYIKGGKEIKLNGGQYAGFLENLGWLRAEKYRMGRPIGVLSLTEKGEQVLKGYNFYDFNLKNKNSFEEAFLIM